MRIRQTLMTKRRKSFSLCQMERSIMFLLLLLILNGLVQGISCSRRSIMPSGNKISHRKLADDSVCPLDFDKLGKIVAKNPVALRFVDVSSECRSLLEAIRIVRSDYLRKTGNFSFPVNASESCWNEYQSLVNGYLGSYAVRSTCGVQTQWISNSCLDVSTKSQFEALVPESHLQEITKLCSQSLNDNSSCVPCLAAVSSIQLAYFQGLTISNISDCWGFPSMYAAAFANQFGPTDLGTIKCLFSINYLSSIQRRADHKHKVLIRGVMIGSVTGLLLVILILLLLWRQQSKYRMGKNHVRNAVTEDKASGFKLHSESITLVRFNIEELKQATRKFSRENLIGTGGYGNVYKGILADGSEVAVKRFKNCSVAGDANFTHEVEVIASVRHVNLVALRGYCTATTPLEGHQRIIVCDFIRNGNLHDLLFSSRAKTFSWPIRRKIALGVARGLAYLQNGVQPAIIHRDIKASNILLDDSFEPKLADFGLAKFTPDGFSHFSTRVAGTLGYVSPEYALYGQLTEKSDVYSFGVVLLELLSGKKAVISMNDDHQAVLLTDWAWSLVKEGRALDIVDENMPEIEPSELMEKHVLAAILCVHPLLHARPTMNQIVNILETDIRIATSNIDPLFPTAAEIDDNERLISFTGTSNMFSLADQHPTESQNSMLRASKIEEFSTTYAI